MSLVFNLRGIAEFLEKDIVFARLLHPAHEIVNMMTVSPAKKCSRLKRQYYLPSNLGQFLSALLMYPCLSLSQVFCTSLLRLR